MKVVVNHNLTAVDLSHQYLTTVLNTANPWFELHIY